MAWERDLFGNRVTLPDVPVGRGPVPTNDMGLVRDVVDRARRVGFVVYGYSDWVFEFDRECDERGVVRCSSDVEYAVGQLLSVKWFALGGEHRVVLDGYDEWAQSVLVTRKAATALERWGNFP